MNVKGLLNPDEGLFTGQTQFTLSQRPDLTALLSDYRSRLVPYVRLLPNPPAPAFGARPEPVVLRGWRRRAMAGLRSVTQFIDRVYLPTIR